MILIGRRSSHYTRLALFFAETLGIEYRFQAILDIASLDPDDFGGHPGLNLPTLQVNGQRIFGSLPICRGLVRRAARRPTVVWPEQLERPLLSNAWELTSQAMATQVRVVFSRLTGVADDNVMHRKAIAGLRGLVGWLDDRLPEIREAMPPGDLNAPEVALYCLGRHLDFRETMPLADFPHLARFCDRFESRHPAALATAYRFDS